MGVKGLSIATSITYISSLVILTVYISFKKGFVPEESWHFFNRDSIKNLCQFLKFSVTSAMMIV